MTFKFPTSGTTLSVPSIGATFGVGTKIWTWDGSVFFRSDLGQRGATGATGATGVGVSDVKVGNDGKLSVSLDTGATLDVGDVVKPAGFKYLINVNPGTTGVALLGVQGATSNTLIFNNVDLDENDTGVFFNEIAASPKNTTLTIKSLVGATQVSLKLDGVTAVAGTNFRQITGASGSGFDSPFTIGDFVFIFKETSGKTGAGITNAKLTPDGRLTFDTIDADGATTAVIDVGEVRGATGSTGQDGVDGASAAGFDYDIVETFRYKVKGIASFPMANGDFSYLGSNPLTGATSCRIALTDLDGKNATSFLTSLANRFNSSRAEQTLGVELMLAQENEIYTITRIGSLNLTSSGSAASLFLGISFENGTPPTTGDIIRFADMGNTDRSTPGRMSVGISGSTMFVVPTIDTKRGTNIQPVLNKIPLADEMLVTTTDGVTLNDGTIGGIVRVNNRFQQFALNPFDGVTFAEGTTVFLSTIGTQGASGANGVTGATGTDGVTGASGAGFTNPVLNADGTLTITTITNSGAEGTVNIGTVRGATGATGPQGPQGNTGATGAAGTNTDPDTNPGIDIGGSAPTRDGIANSFNTIAFGDLENSGKGSTQSNNTILAIRDFQDGSGQGGGGISGEDVLIQSKRGLKLARVDLNSGLSPTPAYDDFAIRLMGSDTQGGVTIPAGTDIVLDGRGFDFKAGGSGEIFSIDHRQTQGVKVSQVPFTATNLIAGEDGISLGVGISFPDSTHQKGAAKDVASFTMRSSSAIKTGQKIEAMYRMPYDATLLRLDGKLSSAGNFRGTIDIAGSDFGDPTSSHTEAVAFNHTAGGISFDTTTMTTASVTAGNFLYVDLALNGAGATGAQLFLTYETR